MGHADRILRPDAMEKMRKVERGEPCLRHLQVMTVAASFPT